MNVEDYLLDEPNKDFRPVNDPLIVDAGNTTYTNPDFNPTGVDALTSDIGAMENGEIGWKAGITWNNSGMTDENYVIANSMDFFN